MRYRIFISPLYQSIQDSTRKTHLFQSEFFCHFHKSLIYFFGKRNGNTQFLRFFHNIAAEGFQLRLFSPDAKIPLQGTGCIICTFQDLCHFCNFLLLPFIRIFDSNTKPRKRILPGNGKSTLANSMDIRNPYSLSAHCIKYSHTFPESNFQ